MLWGGVLTFALINSTRGENTSARVGFPFVFVHTVFLQIYMCVYLCVVMYYLKNRNWYNFLRFILEEGGSSSYWNSNKITIENVSFLIVCLFVKSCINQAVIWLPIFWITQHGKEHYFLTLVSLLEVWVQISQETILYLFSINYNQFCFHSL